MYHHHSANSIDLVSSFTSHLIHTQSLSSRISLDSTLTDLVAQKCFTFHPDPNTAKSC